MFPPRCSWGFRSSYFLGNLLFLLFAIPQDKPAALVIFYYSDDDRQADRQMDR